MIRNLYCTQTINMAVMKMLSALMGVQGEFVFATKMLFALLLLTPTSFGQVKFWWPGRGLFEPRLRSISWTPYAWWPWPWCQVVDLPQGQIKGDTLVSRAGLSYSAFRSSFHGKEKSSWVKNSQTTTRAISLSFKNHGTNMGRSIPYASPPVGSLRWAPPQPVPVPGWEGTRNGR